MTFKRIEQIEQIVQEWEADPRKAAFAVQYAGLLAERNEARAERDALRALLAEALVAIPNTDPVYWDLLARIAALREGK